MNRRTFFSGIAGLAGCTSTTRPRLNVYNWSNYVAPDTIPNFEREFGVRVRYGIFESNEEMLAKALTGNSGWDVVFPSTSNWPSLFCSISLRTNWTKNGWRCCSGFPAFLDSPRGSASAVATSLAFSARCVINRADRVFIAWQ